MQKCYTYRYLCDIWLSLGPGKLLASRSHSDRDLRQKMHAVRRPRPHFRVTSLLSLPHIKRVNGPTATSLASCQGALLTDGVPVTFGLRWLHTRKMETNRLLKRGEIRYLCSSAIPRRGPLHTPFPRYLPRRKA